MLYTARDSGGTPHGRHAEHPDPAELCRQPGAKPDGGAGHRPDGGALHRRRRHRRWNDGILYPDPANAEAEPVRRRHPLYDGGAVRGPGAGGLHPDGGPADAGGLPPQRRPAQHRVQRPGRNPGGADLLRPHPRQAARRGQRGGCLRPRPAGSGCGAGNWGGNHHRVHRPRPGIRPPHGGLRLVRGPGRTAERHVGRNRLPGGPSGNLPVYLPRGRRHGRDLFLRFHRQQRPGTGGKAPGAGL